MAKLHELLAVEADLDGEKTRVMQEALVTFTKKPELFTGHDKQLRMFDDSRSNENAVEARKVDTTVQDKLDYVATSIKRYWDACLQKEATNQLAKADLVVDGNTVAKDVPATFLLKLESELKKFRELVEQIPTHASGYEWKEAMELGAGIFKAMKDASFKTEKIPQHKVLYEATDKHPAQIEKWTEDVKVGKYTHQMFSGMISPSEKSLMIGRVDKLLRSVKQARQRANVQEVEKKEIGESVFNFLFTK